MIGRLAIVLLMGVSLAGARETSCRFRDGAAPTASVAYVLCEPGTVMVTTDGGKTWQIHAGRQPGLPQQAGPCEGLALGARPISSPEAGRCQSGVAEDRETGPRRRGPFVRAAPEREIPLIRLTQVSKQFSGKRRDKIGFIFQFFNLMPSLTCLENVALPLHLRGWGKRKIQERVAIARSLAAFPPILLADEPIGNLDSRSGADILDLMRSLRRVNIRIPDSGGPFGSNQVVKPTTTRRGEPGDAAAAPGAGSSDQFSILRRSRLFSSGATALPPLAGGVILLARRNSRFLQDQVPVL